MKALNVAEVALASGGDGEQPLYYSAQFLNAQYGYVDYSGLNDLFAMLNQRPEFWNRYFVSC